MSDVTFIRKNGKIIPIRGGSSNRSAPKKKEAAKKVEHHKGLKFAATALSIASGVLSGATLFGGGKKLLIGQAVSTGFDIASATTNVASVAGKGHKKERVKMVARQELVNQVIGYGAMAATVVALPSQRRGLISFSGGAYNTLKALGQKALHYAK